MAQTLRNLVGHQALEFPVTMSEVMFLEASGTWRHSPSNALQQFTELLSSQELPEHLRLSCQQHIAAIQALPATQKPPSALGTGLSTIAGGYMPTCYKRFAKTSVLTNQLIRGPVFQLEGQQLYVSLPEALAWVRVDA